MSRLKLITFDLDNTLWPVDEVIRRAEQRCDSWIQEHYPEAADSLDSFRLRLIKGELLQKNPDYQHNLSALRTDALKHGFMDAGYAEIEALAQAKKAFEVFHDARNQVVFFPGAVEMLETLADRYTLGALSNGNADLEKIGIADLFDFHHHAASIGRRKPAPDMFQAALKTADVRPEHALHIGDHPEEDMEIARQLGFHTIWANLLDTPWPAHLSPHQHMVHNLHEVDQLVTLLDD